MTIPKDPRFDLLLCDAPNGTDINDSLGLLLREPNGLDFSLNFVSPQSQLPGADTQDADSSRATVRTQRNWQNGLGREYGYGELIGFSEGNADTRFRNQIVLPPQPTATLLASSGPMAFDDSRFRGTRDISGGWSRGSRVDGTEEVSANWAIPSTFQQTQRRAYVEWDTITYNNTPGQISGEGNFLRILSAGAGSAYAAQRFTVGSEALDITSVGTFLTTIFSSARGGRISIWDGVSEPNAEIAGYTLSNADWDGLLLIEGNWFEAPITVTLDPFANYWVVVEATGAGEQDIGWRRGVGSGTLFESGNGTDWFLESGTAWFRLNEGDEFPVRIFGQIAQSLVSAAGVDIDTISLHLSRQTWTGSPTVVLQIRSDNAGEPSNTILAEEPIPEPTVPGFQEIVFPFTLAPGTAYWLVIEADSSSPANSADIYWWGDATNVGANAGLRRAYETDGVTAPFWSGAFGSGYYFINDGYPDGEGALYFYSSAITRVRQAQQFVTGAALVLTEVDLDIWRTTWFGSPTLRLTLRASGVGGAIGAILATSGPITDPGLESSFVSVPLSYSMLAATSYWLVLEADAPLVTDGITVLWRVDTANGFAGGGSVRQTWLPNTALFGAAEFVGDHYFIVNNDSTTGIGYGTHTRSQDRIAQTITPSSSIALQKLRMSLQITEKSANGTLRVAIYATSAGLPTTEIAGYDLTEDDLSELPSGSPLLGGPSLHLTQRPMYATALISTTLTSGTMYAIVVTARASAIGDSITARIWGDTVGGYVAGQGYTASFINGAWTSWANADMDFYFFVNPGTAPFQHPIKTNPIRFGNDWYLAGGQYIFRLKGNLIATNPAFESGTTGWSQITDGTMSFTAISTEAAEGVQCARIEGLTGTYGSIEQTTTALTAGREYTASAHLKIVKVPTSGDFTLILWFFDSLNAVLGFHEVEVPAIADWQRVTVSGMSPLTCDRVRVQIVAPTGGVVLADDVKLTHNSWVQVLDAGVPVTDLDTIATFLYAALGDSADMQRTTDGTTWAVVAGTRRFTHLRGFGGYLYAAKSTGGADSLAYTDATNWVTNLQIGTPDQRVTHLASYNNELIILGRGRAWSLSGSIVYQISDYSSEEEEDNGRNATTWIQDGKLYIPVRSGLNAYNGAQMQAVGPDGEEGLPIGLRGRISALVGTKAWLFAAIDAGPTGTSGVYAYNGAGWHTIALATGVGRRIRTLGLEVVTSSEKLPRLWWGEDNTPFFIEFPNLSDNPYAYTPSRFAQTGTITSSKLGGEVAVIPKDFQSISVWTDGCSELQRVEVYYEVDNAGIWVLAGTITQSPFNEFFLEHSDFAVKTADTGSGLSTIFLSEDDDTADMSPGEFIRISQEIVQVATIDSASAFTLVTPLTEVPAVGTQLYPSGPSGKSIRYRLTLVSDESQKSPKVNRVSVKMRGLWADKARMAFGPRIEDNMEDRVGAQYPYSATELRELLYDWIKRDKSIIIVDPMGKSWTMFHAATSEVNMRRIDESPTGSTRIASGMRCEFLEI